MMCLEEDRNLETPVCTAVGFCDRLELYPTHLAIAGSLAPLTHERAIICLGHISAVQLKPPGMGTGFLRLVLKDTASECIIFPPEALSAFEQIKMEIEHRMPGVCEGGGLYEPA